MDLSAPLNSDGDGSYRIGMKRMDHGPWLLARGDSDSQRADGMLRMPGQTQPKGLRCGVAGWFMVVNMVNVYIIGSSPILEPHTMGWGGGGGC